MDSTLYNAPHLKPVLFEERNCYGPRTWFRNAEELASSWNDPAACPAWAGLLLVQQVFGLTLAEAKIAAMIAEGIGPREAADKLGIAFETARNQLKAAFAKTDTHRQSELAALLSRLE